MKQDDRLDLMRFWEINNVEPRYNVPFGCGILSQGEVITDAEKQRLVAKRAWLQTWDALMHQTESLKALNLPVPWFLELDPDIIECQNKIRRMLSRFATPQAYLDYVKSDTEKLWRSKDEVLDYVKDATFGDRHKWILEQLIAENPLTTLDVGVGDGRLALLAARRDFQVTGITANENVAEALNEIAREESLPLQTITGIFEVLDFEGRKFDVVIAGEILEHVPNDVAFLQKCVNLANDAVVVTTPRGCCCRGFDSFEDWRASEEHVRAYSIRSFMGLIERIEGIKTPTLADIEVRTTLVDYKKNSMQAFCVRLKKVPQEKEAADGSREHQDVAGEGNDGPGSNGVPGPAKVAREPQALPS